MACPEKGAWGRTDLILRSKNVISSTKHNRSPQSRVDTLYPGIQPMSGYYLVLKLAAYVEGRRVAESMRLSTLEHLPLDVHPSNTIVYFLKMASYA